jgi:hypothetical protein
VHFNLDPQNIPLSGACVSHGRPLVLAFDSEPIILTCRIQGELKTPIQVSSDLT